MSMRVSHATPLLMLLLALSIGCNDSGPTDPDLRVRYATQIEPLF